VTNNHESDVAEAIATFFWKYYSSADEVEQSRAALIFGRADKRLAEVAVTLHARQVVEYFVPTGAVGKDSGQLPTLELSEAGYIAGLMMQYGVPGSMIYGEYAARNGGENCRNSIALMRTEQLIPALDDTSHEVTRVVLVAHWASLYRLFCMMKTVSRILGFRASFTLVPTARPDRLDDTLRTELIAEFRRLMDWPNLTNPDGSTWLDAVELPPELVERVNAIVST
jgi:DUF218 domain